MKQREEERKEGRWDAEVRKKNGQGTWTERKRKVERRITNVRGGNGRRKERRNVKSRG